MGGTILGMTLGIMVRVGVGTVLIIHLGTMVRVGVGDSPGHGDITTIITITTGAGAEVIITTADLCTMEEEVPLAVEDIVIREGILQGVQIIHLDAIHQEEALLQQQDLHIRRVAVAHQTMQQPDRHQHVRHIILRHQAEAEVPLQEV